MTCTKISQIEASYEVDRVSAFSPLNECKHSPKGFIGILDKRESFVAVFTRYFWIFMMCCVIGLMLEEVYHLAVFHELENRTGLLLGPFSPIYGIGGVCIVAVSQLVAKKPLPFTFLCFAVVGGMIEFLVSFMLESCFGIVAWDYTGSWLSIDGRTNGYFMIMWGLLGLACVRFLVPAFDKTFMPMLERIPLIATKTIAIGMTINIVLTLVSFNCWYHRLDGEIPSTPTQQVCATLFNDEFMANHFQSMSLHPDQTLRN